MPLAPDAVGALAVEILYSPTPLRAWTGEGSLAHGGVTYSGGMILDIGEASIAAEEPIDSFAFDLNAISDAERGRYLNNDPGPLPAKVLWLLKEDGETSFAEVASFEGRLDEARYSDGVLSLTLRAVAWDIDKGATVLWDNATQQRLHPGDLGFGYVAQLQGKDGPDARVPWPPG